MTTRRAGPTATFEFHMVALPVMDYGTLTQAQKVVAVTMPERGPKGLQAAVKQAAEWNGWLYFHDEDSRLNNPGFPDCVLSHPARGEMIVAELKKVGGKLTECQKQWLAAFVAAGVETHIWTPIEWLDNTILRRLKGESE